MDFKTKAAVRGGPLIALAIFFLFCVGYAVSALLNLPFNLSVPFWLRAVGAAPVVVGIGLIGWTFRLRGFTEVVASTYVTMTKFVTRTPLEEKAGREEPLVIIGPYRFVRHPLYLGAVVIVLGWGLLTALSFMLVTAGVIFVWFRVFLCPSEEKELRTLFPEQYSRYASEVPMMIPFTQFRRKKASSI